MMHYFCSYRFSSLTCYRGWDMSKKRIKVHSRTSPQATGKRLRRAREKIKISRDELAVRIGVRMHTVYRWEHGMALPNAKYIAPLCEVLGATAGHLLGTST